MFAVIAAILFGLALLLDLIDESFGDVVTTGTLTLAGLFFVALHLAVPRPRWGRRWQR